MPPMKRKHSYSSDECSLSDLDIDGIDKDLEDDDVDISSALTGKRPKNNSRPQNQSDGEEDFSIFLQDAIAKHNVRSGTELLKKTKGKAKLAKGEVGGGSFQSMGTSRIKQRI